MGLVQKDAFRTMIISYLGIVLGYLNKGLLFILLFSSAQIGLINLIVSIGTLFAQLANFGAIFTVWKFFPFFRNKEKNHFGFLTFILLVVLAGILVFTILYIVFREPIQASYAEKSPLFNSYYYWTLPIGISYVVFLVLEAYLRSLYKNIVAVFAYEVGLRVLTTVLLIGVIPGWVSFDLFLVLHSLLYLIPTIIVLVYLYRLDELKISFSEIQISKRFKKIIFQVSSFYYVNTLGVVLVNSLDIIMIAQLIGLDAAGVYSTVIFLSSAMQVPYRSIIRVSSPLVADYWKHREFDKMKELYQKVSSVSLVLGMAMFVLAWTNIDFLFSFLKPEFHEGIWVFFAIMMGKLVDMYFGLNGAIFTTSKKYKYELIFTILLIGIVYALNLVMIPKWGIVGAAISTSIALLVFNFGRLIFIWAAYKIHPFTKNQFIVIGLGVLALTVGHFTQGLISNKWIQCLVESTLVSCIFFIPIVVFSLEKETIGYLKKGFSFIKSKVS
jgi:O-antigen/teichoic acid export membrane protein